jgi:uncharacterized membrane protein
MKMSSYGIINAQNSTGKVASTTSTEAVTLNSIANRQFIPSLTPISEEPKIDYAKRYLEFSSLLYRGYSFPLHDDIDHLPLDTQSGVFDPSQYKQTILSVTSTPSAPVYLLFMWLFTCFSSYIYISFPFIMSSYLYIFSYFVYCYIISSCIMLLVNWICRSFKPVLTPQSGILQVDPYIKEVIQIWCLFESLQDARSKRGMVSAITQYLQAHTSQSLPVYLYCKAMSIPRTSDWTSDDGVRQVEAMLEEAFGPSALEDIDDDLFMLDPQGGGMPWHQAVDLAFTNWKEFRTSSIAAKFTHLVNVIVSAGMCSTANLTFKVGDVLLFSPIVSKKQLVAADVFEAFYEAVSGFMKGGWRVFKTQEVSAFFMEDDKISAFDALYNQLRSWHGYALAGNLREYTDIDEN